MSSDQLNRREFMRASAGVTALGAATKTTLLSPRPLQAAARAVPPSDRVRFASIGTGVEGCVIMQAALACPGTEIVAASDLYDGRITAACEYAKKNIFTLAITSDDKLVLKRDKGIDEPLQFYSGKEPALFEVVVNTINSKDQVSGYLSVPKNAPAPVTATAQ